MENKKEANAISNKADITFSILLLPITMIGLSIAFYFFYIRPSMFPLILIAAIPFGLSCIGLQRLYLYRKRGNDVTMVK